MNDLIKDLNSPKVALGTWAWGEDKSSSKVFGNSLTAADLQPVFDEAMKQGLNLFDTAAVYNNGDSENILGSFVKNVARNKLILSTKFTPQIADNSEHPIASMLDESLKRLHTDYVDIYWIHNDADVEKWTKEIIPVAKSGKIKHIGVSNHTLDEIKRANEILNEAGLKISAVQNHFSLLDQTSKDDGIIEYCHENGIAFFSYMVLERGALSGKYDSEHPFPENSQRASAYNGKLDQLNDLIVGMRKIGENHDVNVAQIANAWAIESGTIPIIGATKAKHIADAAEAAQIQLSNDEIKQLDDLAKKTSVDTTREWEQNLK